MIMAILRVFLDTSLHISKFEPPFGRGLKCIMQALEARCCRELNFSPEWFQAN